MNKLLLSMAACGVLFTSVAATAAPIPSSALGLNNQDSSIVHVMSKKKMMMMKKKKMMMDKKMM